jgi:hypothetical protein
MKALFKYTLPALAIATLAACSEDSLSTATTEPVDPNAGKELIALSKDDGVTRATLTRAGFDADKQTKVLMRIKAEEVKPSSPALDARWAEAVATATKTKDTGHDADHSVVGTPHSDLSYAAGQERYWDDAFGRNSKLTIYAFAIPGKIDAPLPTWSSEGWTAVNSTTNPNWKTGPDHTTVSWSVSAAQTAETMGKEDLTYSNNIKDGETQHNGRYTHAYSPAYDNDTYPKALQDALVMGMGQMRWWPKTIANADEKSNNTFASTTGKFDQGHLVFKHACAWIEINLKEDDGFNNSATTDFGWTRNHATATQNITLKGFYTTRMLDVANDSWSGTTSVDITQMVENNVSHEGGGKTTRKLYAYVLPGNNLYENGSNVIEFEIDNAKYYVTGTQIANAIRTYYTTGAGKNESKASSYTGFTTTKAGEHYVINLKVAKKGIDRITAAVIDWEPVNSDDITAQNTYPTFTFEDRGTKLVSADADEFNIYRAAKTAGDYITGTTVANYDWAAGYLTPVGTESVVAEKNFGTKHANEWSTGWHWPDNQTYFHFRAVGINGGNAASDPDVINYTTTAAASPTPGSADYFNIHSGAITGSSYKDYTWGAPFKDIDNAPTGKLTYDPSSHGFDGTASHQISNAIGATESLIQMLLFHMTTQIIVNVSTTTGPDEVTLLTNDGSAETDKTKVEILNFLPDGTVLMGNGLVTATGTRTTQFMTYGTYTAKDGETPAKVADYTYGMIPQALSTGGQTIGLRITTPDKNQYVITDLSTIVARVTTAGGNGSTYNITNPYTESGSGTKKYLIDSWRPNFKYTYNIVLKKKGIERITAAVVGWEEVVSDDITIDLEN